MDEKVTRQRIRRAVDPGEGFPDAGLLERTMNRLQESDRGHPRPWPWLVAAAVAVLTAGAVGTLMVSRLPHSASPLQVAPGASGRVPTIALPSTRSGVVDDFQFASATSGWLLEYGADGHSRVLQTTDGGAHWAQVGDLAGLRPYATSLDFIGDQGSVIVGPPQTGADMSAAAAAGARVYSTGDGGAHWRVADVPAAMDFLRSASFVSPDEGWIVMGPA